MLGFVGYAMQRAIFWISWFLSEGWVNQDDGDDNVDDGGDDDDEIDVLLST